ncbi:PML-RARA-regulated adapter molecule 1 [Cebus imitator]|uniref:PML-RARA-regulated adapter molecule 1 n=1 Tax=Cebus imitator TaxID=2715852 RepID=UPI001896D3F0|nr:PML-RARA-regulated adapter molecule 1 [Cebus imitator]
MHWRPVLLGPSSAQQGAPRRAGSAARVAVRLAGSRQLAPNSSEAGQIPVHRPAFVQPQLSPAGAGPLTFTADREREGGALPAALGSAAHVLPSPPCAPVFPFPPRKVPEPRPNELPLPLVRAGFSGRRSLSAAAPRGPLPAELSARGGSLGPPWPVRYLPQNKSHLNPRAVHTPELLRFPHPMAFQPRRSPEPGTESYLESRDGATKRPPPYVLAVEQKPLSLPEDSSPSSGPTHPVALHLPAAMETHQDFRSIQAKFRASQQEPSSLPKKTPKPEFSKFKKLAQPELSEHPKKPPQPEFGAVSLKPPKPEVPDLPEKPLQPEVPDLPEKPLQPEVPDLPEKPLQPEVPDLPKKPSKLELTELSRKFPQLEATPFAGKPLQPEAGEAPLKAPMLERSTPAQKPLQPELSHPSRLPSDSNSSTFPRKHWQPEACKATPKPSQPQFSTIPKKPLQPEFNVHPRKPPQPQVGGLPKKSLPQAEFSEVPQTAPCKHESSDSLPHSPKPNFTLPKKPPQPEFSVYPRKPPQPQVSGFPKKSLPEFNEAAQTPLWKPESSEPKPDFNVFPKKPSQPQLSDFPKKPPQPKLGDLPRTSSEPEVSVFPKRPRQPEFKALSKKPLQPELGGLPRTSSEPEFNSLPRKLLRPECQGPPRKFSQPEPSAVLKRQPQPEFFGDRPRKPVLPSSASESSLPAAVVGSSSRYPPSPGFGVTGTPHWRPGGLVHSGRARPGLRPSHPPRRRSLPPASSLGPPPAKPPLPPVPMDIQSFRRPSAASTDLRRTRSAAGLHFQIREPEDTPQDPDEIYELYDDVEPRDDSSPSPKGRGLSVACPDEVPSVQQAARRPPQDPVLRKEKDPQPQQLPPMDPKLLKQMRKAEKAEREFRKKFKFEGEIVVHTKMMIDPNAKTRRGGGKHLGIRRGEILEVIEFTSKDEMLCRDPKGKYGYVPRTALLPLETEVYDDVDFLDPLENLPLPLGR